MRLGGSESLPSIAANRQIEPRQLSAQIHGELDWIVMKSLEKDRARRYDTASKLADDVRHFLDGDAVEACPPSALYRFRKFARRNNVAITTMAVVLAALLVGTGVATWQAVRATAERDRAIVAEAVAGAEATRSKQVAQFLKDMLASAGPSVARGRDATLLREVLSRTAERVERDLANQPDLQGDMWFTLGTTYQDIGDHRAAVTTFERAVESYRIAPGEPNAKLAIALARLGYSHSFLKDLAEGNRNAESGLEMARLGGDREALAVCLYYRALASNEFGTGSNQAVPYLEESLKLYREMGNRPIAEADCMWHLAVCGVGDDRGESLARQAHQIFYEHLGPNHPKTLGAQWALGQILLIQGKAANAEPILRSTLKTWEAIYDKDHPHRYVVRNRLALSLALQNNWDEAYEVLESAPTTTHPRELQYLDFYRDLFDLLADEGRFEDENTVLQEMQKRLDEVQSIYGPDHRFTKDYQSILTNMIARIGEEEEARQLKDLAERSESEDGSGEEETNDSHAEAAKSIGIEDVELSDSSLDD